MDVCAFSCKQEQIEDEELLAFIEADTARIRSQIEAWNAEVYESNFARNFKVLFVRCKDFYEEEIDEESRKLTRLNISITKLMAEEIAPEILEPLQQMVKDAQVSVNELKDVSRRLKELQNEFFTEIKYISDIVGIAMPEPSEIDLLQDKIQDPLQLIENYRKEKGLKQDPEIVKILSETFEGIEPVINKKAGGGEYRNELMDVMKENLEISPADIHINDVLYNSKEYKELISKV